MAKKSVLARNNRRKKFSKIASANLKALRKAIRGEDGPEKEAAALKLSKIRRDSCSIRVRARCNSCGRGRGVIKRFGLCRICVRQAACRGDIPGLTKASW